MNTQNRRDQCRMLFFASVHGDAFLFVICHKIAAVCIDLFSPVSSVKMKSDVLTSSPNVLLDVFSNEANLMTNCMFTKAQVPLHSKSDSPYDETIKESSAHNTIRKMPGSGPRPMLLLPTQLRLLVCLCALALP
ncbi:hypothetical protein Tsp_10223 [Trichinella spiralis]|uniref:hypothetical protein n=1 Tax=Trichinella spiralis TaxID=6334 RepID=UPI0001EFDDFA|nr:hypothetical protein Tsp_10223 [Trichinella spiralis]